jgi:hypothetical protein
MLARKVLIDVGGGIAVCICEVVSLHRAIAGQSQRKF